MSHFGKLSNQFLKDERPLLIILFFSFLIRIINFNFPFFTTDEARVAFRGYSLSRTGLDELGRGFPILFNSLTDYQLPSVSYLTAFGQVFFGKSDLWVRLPFILIGVLTVYFVYKISQQFSPKKEFWLISSLMVALSLPLIFLSKIPNEYSVLTLLILVLFYLLTRKKINFFLIFSITLLSFLTSKIAWFVLTPFILFTIFFYQDNLSKKYKIRVSIICILLNVLALGIFLRIPQAMRSLLDNNFPILNDTGIINAIARLRGQGIEAHFPNTLERIFFSKLVLIPSGFSHWLWHLQPGFLFGQFDESGRLGFTSLGAWSKIFVVPSFLGLIALIRKESLKIRLIPVFIIIMTYPLLFVYPMYSPSYVVLTLPFMALILALGFSKVPKSFTTLIIGLAVLDIFINLFNLSLELKNTNFQRPIWIKSIVSDGVDISTKNMVAFSDNITDDVASFIEWYSPIKLPQEYQDVKFPYKFRQSTIDYINDIKIIDSNVIFYKCGFDKPVYIFATDRDVRKIQKWLNLNPASIIKKEYKDNLGNDVVYLLDPTICVR